MSIADKVTDAWYAFPHPADLPKFLFLGEQEWDELAKEAKENGFLMLPAPRSEAHRPEYRGMKVFRVDARSFLRLG